MVGEFHGMLPAICRNIQDLLCDGKTPCERRFGEPFGGPMNTTWCNGRISPYFCQRPVATASVRHEKSYQECSSAMYCTRGGIWKGDILSHPIAEWEKMDASEIHAQETQCKGSVNAQKSVKHFCIPERRWKSQIIRQPRPGSENIHLNPTAQTEEKNQGKLPGESDVPSPTPRQDSSRDDG